MNIIQLSYFLTVYEQGSYAAAAKELFTSRQTLGRAVSELENELGRKLFARQGRGIIPTEFGHEAANITREILAGTQKLNDLAKGEANPDENQDFTLGIIDSGFKGALVMDENFEQSLQKGSNIHFSIQYLSNGQSEPALESKAVDATIMLGNSEQPAFAYEYVGKQIAHLAVSSAHPFSQRKSLNIGDLGQIELAQPEDLHFLYPRVNALCEAFGVDLHWKFIRQNEKDHADFIRSGGGVFVESCSLLVQHNPDFVAVPMADSTNLTYPFYYVERKKDRSRTGRAAMKSVMNYFGGGNVFPHEEE